MPNAFKILEVKKGEYVRFSEAKDGRLLRRVAISRLKAGMHLVDIELPSRPETPLLQDWSPEQVTTICSAFEVEVDGVRKTIADVLRENDIFKEAEQIH